MIKGYREPFDSPLRKLGVSKLLNRAAESKKN